MIAKNLAIPKLILVIYIRPGSVASVQALEESKSSVDHEDPLTRIGLTN